MVRGDLCAQDVPKDLKCIQKSISGGSLDGHRELGFVEDYVNHLVKNPGLGQWAIGMDNFRVNMASQLTGVPTSGERMYEEYKTEDGETERIIRLYSTMASQWDNPEFLSKAALQICNTYYQDLGSFCHEAFLKKMESIQTFLMENHRDIESMKDELLKEGAVPREILGSRKFKFDGVFKSLAEAGFSPYMSMDEFRASYGRNSTPVFRKDSRSPLPAGYMVPISVSGKTQYFFAELKPDPRNPFGGTVTWPYFFVFGRGDSKEWNAHFQAKYGGQLGIPSEMM